MIKKSPIDTRLRMISWNLWWQFGPWQDRARAILTTLKDHDADVIALQEVWDDGTDNFAAQLAADLGYHHVYAPGARPNGVHMGNAILSRWPILDHKITNLFDKPAEPEMRVALYANIDGPRGNIPAFSTHLNWQAHDSETRQKQVAELAQFIHQTRPWKFPPIIGGDFNANPVSTEMRMMTGETTCPVNNLAFLDAWAFSNKPGAGHTWDNANPFAASIYEANRRIDYIFAWFPKANGLGHITDCRIVGNAPIEGIWPSDHFAVLAEFRY